MLVCLDVDYRENTAVTGCVGFAAWDSSEPLIESTHRLAGSSDDYQPGDFYLRELPSLLGAIGALSQPPVVVIVDGYVWLGPGKKGLGAHLYDALGESVPVVGVAKNPYHSATTALEIYRGDSRRPLFVTAIGIDANVAARHVSSMAGDYRIPAMLKRADQLARTG